MPAKKVKKDFRTDAKDAKAGDKKAIETPGQPNRRKPNESRPAKLYVAITKDTWDRLDDSIPPEKRKRRKKGERVWDKGAVVEEALTAWLKKHKY